MAEKKVGAKPQTPENSTENSSTKAANSSKSEDLKQKKSSEKAGKPSTPKASKVQTKSQTDSVKSDNGIKKVGISAKPKVIKAKSDDAKADTAKDKKTGITKLKKVEKSKIPANSSKSLAENSTNLSEKAKAEKGTSFQAQLEKAEKSSFSKDERREKGAKLPFRTEFKPKLTFAEFEATYEDDDEDFETLLNESEREESVSLVEGKIVRFEKDEVFVDIGEKAEGILAVGELRAENDGKKGTRKNLSASKTKQGDLSDENLAENDEKSKELLFKVGDNIKVAIVGRRGGRALLSYKKALRKEKVAEFIANLTDADLERIFEVKIISKNKGGFSCVNSDGVEFFLPKSHYTFKDINAVGKILNVKILRVEPEGCSIVVSRRAIVEEERKKQRKIFSDISSKVGEIFEGTVQTITKFGIFVDVGGVDGLVHFGEISHRKADPRKLYREGDQVAVKLLKYDDEKKQLSLSIKAAQPDPWDEIRDNLEVGDTIKVVVTNIESYGAFVDIGNDIEGFLHISEMTWDRGVNDPHTIVQLGQELDVEVIDINPESKRLRVSLKNLLAKPFDEFSHKHSVGEVVKGEVVSTTNFGAFVKIDGVEGLLHNEDCSWNRDDKCSELFKKGDKIDVKIIRIDTERQKLSLSTRELTQSPIREYIKAHKVGQIIKGKIRDIKEFGIFVQLDESVDALIHKDDIGVREFEDAKVGDEIEAAILSFDEKRDRIRLSVKNMHRIQEREALQKFNKNADDKEMTLGDLIKEKLN